MTMETDNPTDLYKDILGDEVNVRDLAVEGYPNYKFILLEGLGEVDELPQKMYRVPGLVETILSYGLEDLDKKEVASILEQVTYDYEGADAALNVWSYNNDTGQDEVIASITMGTESSGMVKECQKAYPSHKFAHLLGVVVNMGQRGSGLGTELYKLMINELNLSAVLGETNQPYVLKIRKRIAEKLNMTLSWGTQVTNHKGDESLNTKMASLQATILEYLDREYHLGEENIYHEICAFAADPSFLPPILTRNLEDFGPEFAEQASWMAQIESERNKWAKTPDEKVSLVAPIILLK